MKGPYIDHQYCITWDGNNPDNPTKTPLWASSYEEAQFEAERFSKLNEIPIEQFQIFYRIQAIAHSDWAEVGQGTDYKEAINKIMGL